MNIEITRVNISSPNGCQIKTIKCEEEAYWFVGEMSLCDNHLKLFCDKARIDYDGCVEEVKEQWNTQ